MDFVTPIIAIIEGFYLMQLFIIVTCGIFMLKKHVKLPSLDESQKRKVTYLVKFIAILFVIFGIPYIISVTSDSGGVGGIIFIIMIVSGPAMIAMFLLGIIRLVISLVNKKLGVKGLIGIIIMSLIRILISNIQSSSKLDQINVEPKIEDNVSTNNSTVFVSGGSLYDY